MDRYSRQLLYKNIGKDGQKKLFKSSVCIVGVGALGSVCSELLARAGVGNLVLIDRDYVDITNLQRQFLFSEEDVGKPKAFAAKEKLSRINSEIKIASKIEDLYHLNIDELIGKTDLILGCTDNMESRFLINDYSLKNEIPWIYGGAVADRGSVFNIIPKKACIRCFLTSAESETCDTAGIINSCSSLTASIMANEALKILLNKKYEEKLIHIDLWKNEFLKFNIRKKEDCYACKKIYDYLNGKDYAKAIKLCGKGAYQIRGKKIDLDEFEERLKKLGKVSRFSGLLHFSNFVIFEDGRVIIKADSERDARVAYSKIIGN